MALPAADSGGAADAPPAPPWMQQIVSPKPKVQTPLLPGNNRLYGYSDPGMQAIPGPTINVPPQPNATGQYVPFNANDLQATPVGGGLGGAMPAPTPVIPSEADWLTKDAIYQALQARLNRSLNDFTANKQKQDSLIDTNATEQHGNLAHAQEQDQGDLLSRAASMGALLGNTGYAGLLNNINTDYSKRNTGVDTNATNAHQSLTDALAALQASNQDELDQGRADSLARRLAKYGL